MDEGQIEVESIEPISIKDVTRDLARESGFDGVADLLGTAKHGRGDNVYLIRFRYLAPPKNPRFEVARKIALKLPRVVEGTTYGSPAFLVDGKMFACLAVHRSAEPDTLVVRMDRDERDELIDAEPLTYYLTDHYVDYACVLVRLARIREDALRDLLMMAWRFMSSSRRRS